MLPESKTLFLYVVQVVFSVFQTNENQERQKTSEVKLKIQAHST